MEGLEPDLERMVEELRQAMGLASREEMLRVLIRQAYYRHQLVCPACGHAFEPPEGGRAQCLSCFSLLRIVQGYWAVLERRGLPLEGG